MEIFPDSKQDVFRTSLEFDDLLRLVAFNYEMYSKAFEIIGPIISKQFNNTFFTPPEKEYLDKLISGRGINIRNKMGFIDSIINFLVKNKGKKALIYPSPTTHHSAQFQHGTFSITKIDNSDFKIELVNDKLVKIQRKVLYKIELAGCNEPIYVDKLPINIDAINFLIIRPKMGRLGMPSIKRWEILFYKKKFNYIIDHVDSQLNPRFSGIL